MRAEWGGFAAQIGLGVETFDRLHEGYGAEERRYHDWSHIEGMLGEYRSIGVENDALELAIWFHDVVYDVERNDNEKASAALLLEVGSGRVLESLLERAERLILATEHKAEPKTAEEELMVDLDLSVLGSEPEDYERYAKAIREEYSVYGDDPYRVGRIAALRTFYERKAIFRTKWFMGRNEQAFANLAWELSALGDPDFPSLEAWEAGLNWKQLEGDAEEIVKSCIEELPTILNSKAKELPYLIRRWHPNVESGDDEARDMLGEYLPVDGEGLGAEHGVIAIYVGGIALYCEEEAAGFEEEVRRTYLHELGHHFGWDEVDLAERGLD